MADGEFHVVVAHPAGETAGQVATSGSDTSTVCPDRIAVGHEVTVRAEPEAFESRQPLIVDVIRQGYRLIGTGFQAMQAIAAGVNAGERRQYLRVARDGREGGRFQRRRYMVDAPRSAKACSRIRSARGTAILPMPMLLVTNTTAARRSSGATIK